LTLRSAANAFKDLDGGLLDGNRDGTRGDNAVHSFVISPSDARVVGLRDLARGPGQSINLPAATGTGIPIRISEASGVESLDLTLTYDPTLVSITGATVAPGLPTDVGLVSNLTTPGLATFSLTAPTGLPAGAHDLILLTASVPGTAVYRDKHILDLTQVSINEGAMAVVGDDALHVVAYLGDTTGNASYSSLDATRAQRVVVQLDSGFQLFPLVDPVIIGDTTENEALSSLDATRLQQEVVGQDRPEIPPIPGTVTPTFLVGPDPLVNIPTALTGLPGATVTVPVNVDNAAGIEAADIVLKFDPNVLTFVAAHAGTNGAASYNIRVGGKLNSRRSIRSLHALFLLDRACLVIPHSGPSPPFRLGFTQDGRPTLLPKRTKSHYSFLSRAIRGIQHLKPIRGLPP
jgi:voltage-gated potassium channel Kch